VISELWSSHSNLIRENVQDIVMICLCVCLLAYDISKTTRPNFTEFSVHAACGRGSVLLWRRCDALCTSGCVDNVVFSLNGPYGAARAFLSGYCRNYCTNSNQILKIVGQIEIVGIWRSRAKCAVYDALRDGVLWTDGGRVLGRGGDGRGGDI